ncbi:MAG: hypothetical protein IIB94_07560 [Candidatus Marinimicrobia bacterium]|nr:hypothetical protein [Candidatus Neomarinimicrobiota bacterium]
MSANQNLNNRVIARSEATWQSNSAIVQIHRLPRHPSFDGLLAMTLFQKNKNGDPKDRRSYFT